MATLWVSVVVAVVACVWPGPAPAEQHPASDHSAGYLVWTSIGQGTKSESRKQRQRKRTKNETKQNKKRSASLVGPGPIQMSDELFDPELSLSQHLISQRNDSRRYCPKFEGCRIGISSALGWVRLARLG